MKKTDKKELAKTVLKPIWFPAICFGKFLKEAGEELLRIIRNDEVCDIAGGLFIFALLTGVATAFLCILSFIFLKLWVTMIIVMYFSMFYIRDQHKKKNK